MAGILAEAKGAAGRIPGIEPTFGPADALAQRIVEIDANWRSGFDKSDVWQVDVAVSPLVEPTPASLSLDDLKGILLLPDYNKNKFITLIEETASILSDPEVWSTVKTVASRLKKNGTTDRGEIRKWLAKLRPHRWAR